MNPVTLRRLLVFGVCAVGVGALYLAPALTHAPGEVASPLPDDEPTSLPSATTTATLSGAGRSAAGVDRTPSIADPAPANSRQDASARRSPAARPSSTGATAYDPRTSSDRVAPAPVTDITSGSVNRDRLTLSWPAATDNVGVLQYRVVLNGFTVATTKQTHATIRWFNDDSSANVVQVRALDAAGNESPSSPNLLVSRPTPEPAPAPSPSGTVSPSQPEVSPSPEPSPSDSAPSDQPSATVEPNGGEQSAEASSPQPSTTAGAH